MEKRACRINGEFLNNFVLVGSVQKFLERNEMNSNLGRLNTGIEPYGSNCREIKSNELMFVIGTITRPN